jgi:hypothetical protein
MAAPGIDTQKTKELMFVLYHSTSVKSRGLSDATFRLKPPVIAVIAF